MQDKKGLAKYLIGLFTICLAAGMIGHVPILWAGNSGKLLVHPMEFDCGIVDEGIPAMMPVTIENRGDTEAVIHNVRTN